MANEIKYEKVTATNVTASGHVSASVFYGDGSGLSNVAGAGGGTVTEVTVGTGLNVTNGTSTPAISLNFGSLTLSEGLDASGTSLSLDLSELNDMTDAVVGSEDELVILDNGSQKRKLVSEITLSDFNNDSNFTSNTGTVTSVATGDGLTGGTITGTGTISVDLTDTSIFTATATGDRAVVRDSSGDAAFGMVVVGSNGVQTNEAFLNIPEKLNLGNGLLGSDHHKITGSVDIKNNLTASGTVTATSFYGDGSNITGLVTTANVRSAGALMDDELASISDVKALNQSLTSGASPTFSTANMTDAANKRFMTDAQETKLDSVESNADVTDTANVVAALTAGTNITIAGDGTISSTDTNTQLSTEQVQDIAGPLVATGGTKTGITVTYDDVNGNMDFVVATQSDENFTSALLSKLNGIEASADVTDTANVTAAGALMDSEVDADIKTLSLPANTIISEFGASLVDDTTAAAARATLGLGSIATLSSIDISTNTNLAASTGITLTNDTLTTNDGQIVHDNLSGFVANEHIDHTTVSITAGTGLTGGGTIAATRTINVGAGTGITVNANDVAINTSVVPRLSANNIFTGNNTIFKEDGDEPILIFSDEDQGIAYTIGLDNGNNARFTISYGTNLNSPRFTLDGYNVSFGNTSATHQITGSLYAKSASFDGHVGIGISAHPGRALYVNGNTTTTDLTASGHVSASSFHGDGSSLTGIGTVTGTGANKQIVAWDGVSSITGSGLLYLNFNSTRLGINTSSPEKMLDVDGPVKLGNDSQHESILTGSFNLSGSLTIQKDTSGANSDYDITFKNTNGNDLGRIYTSGSSDFKFGSVTNAWLFSSLGNTYIRSYVLDVDIGAPEVLISGSLGTYIFNQSYFGGTNTSNKVSTFTSDGKLGVKNIFPDYDLDVNGDVKLGSQSSNKIFMTGSVYLSETQAGTGTDVLIKDSNNRIVTAGIDSRVFGSDLVGRAQTGLSNYVALWSGGGSITYDSGLYFNTSNTRLGINVGNTPSYTLDVNGTAGFSDTIFGNSSGYLIVPSDDSNTGLHSPGADKIALVTGGQYRLWVENDGDVGIGTTSPQARLDVDGDAKIAGGLTVNGDSNGTLTIVRSTSSPTGSLIVSGSDTSNYGDDDIIIYNFTPGIRLVDRSTAKSNFRLGCDSDVFKISIDNDFDNLTTTSGHYDDDEDALVIRDNGLEGGLVGINCTPFYRLDVKEETTSSDSNKYVARFFNDGNDADAYGIVIQCGKDTDPQGKNVVYLDARDGNGSSTGQLRVASNGVFSLADTSDERLKENIRETEINALEVVKDTGIYDYEWKKTGVTRKCGFVAQDLEKQLPDAVSENEQDNGEKIKMVHESMMIPVLVKAMQQQQELIDNLTARIQELESKIQ